MIKRDIEDIVYTNGENDINQVFEYLITDDSEPILTTDGEFIIIA